LHNAQSFLRCVAPVSGNVDANADLHPWFGPVFYAWMISKQSQDTVLDVLRLKWGGHWSWRMVSTLLNYIRQIEILGESQETPKQTEAKPSDVKAPSATNPVVMVVVPQPVQTTSVTTHAINQVIAGPPGGALPCEA
jgi:hypothetical protein